MRIRPLRFRGSRRRHRPGRLPELNPQGCGSKKRSEWNPGKWKQRLKPAVLLWCAVHERRACGVALRRAATNLLFGQPTRSEPALSGACTVPTLHLELQPVVLIVYHVSFRLRATLHTQDRCHMLRCPCISSKHGKVSIFDSSIKGDVWSTFRAGCLNSAAPSHACHC